MAINAQANEVEDYTSTTGGDWRYTADGTIIPTATVRAAPYLYAGDTDDFLLRSLPSAVTTQCITAWTGAPVWTRGTITFFGFTSGGTPVLGLQTTVTTGIVNLVSWNGASWDVLAAGSKPADSTSARFDIFLENYGAGDATERVRVWVRYPMGAAPPFLMIDFSGDCTSPAVTDVDGTFQTSVVPVTGTSAPERAVSQLIVADEPTLRLGLVTLYPNAAGDEIWEAGTYADIDAATPSLSTFIETATAGDKFLCNITPLPASTTITPLTVQVAILAALGATGPTKIKLGIKTGGTEYWGADISLTIVPAMYQLLLTQNPVTAAAWTTSEINALQIGVQAVA